MRNYVDSNLPAKLRGLSWVFLLCLGLSACSDNDSVAQEPVQLSARLSELFQRTCANCHTHSATGAPLAGDQQAWEAILAKGMQATLERTLNGYGGMPPGGQCFECSPEDLTNLIRFMSQPAAVLQRPDNNEARP